MDVLAKIEAFRPSPAGDNWRELDELVQTLVATGHVSYAALPTLLRVFERFPRHDGHGVLWSILHGIESIAGYEPVLVEYVTRTPTEMGITMLKRIIAGGVTAVGFTELPDLVAMLEPRAPVIDYALEPVAARTPSSATRRPLATLLAELVAFHPPQGEVHWNPLLALVAELLDHDDTSIVTPLIETLDRFHLYSGFRAFWPIVNGLEQMPHYASALVSSVKTTQTRYGVTLLLRLLAREVYFVDGEDIAALAGELVTRQAAAPGNR